MSTAIIGRPSLVDLQAEFSRSLRKLLDARLAEPFERRRIADLRALLESLPLATDEFALAARRLQNADRYLRSRERGAARYELRLLDGSLKHRLS